jgi:hypothetical protein
MSILESGQSEELGSMRLSFAACKHFCTSRELSARPKPNYGEYSLCLLETLLDCSCNKSAGASFYLMVLFYQKMSLLANIIYAYLSL